MSNVPLRLEEGRPGAADQGGRRVTNVEHSIEVEVPVRTAYDQWTQFEEFPRFMEGVESVTQRDDIHLHWVAKVAGVRREWMPRSPSRSPTSGWRGAPPKEHATLAW
jgi:uncharacterized membrane protein